MEGKILGVGTSLAEQHRYLLQQQLGNETGRKTFLALDQSATDITHNHVVIKLLSLGNDFSWQHHKLFTREAETLKNLQYPAIPRYLDYLEIDEPDFKGFALVQTYIEAENLEQQLKAGRTFSEVEVVQIAQALLDTLIYLQAQNPAIIHRDIKPSNILLANRSGHQVGDVYLVDFGSVQNLAAQEGSTITVVGTYGYMPPEQFGGRTTPATDLYSLGATLIYLVTGRHPTELPQENLRIQFASFANLSPAFSDWLAWLTEPSLEQRLSTATEALEALNNQTIRQLPISEIQATELAKNFVIKPNHTDVICKKSTEHIEFIIPTPGLGFAIVGFAIVGLFLLIPFAAIPYYVSEIAYYGYHYTLEIYPSTFFLLYVVLFILCLMVILYANFIYYGKMKLRIDRSQISLKKQLWGFKLNILPPSYRENIQSIHTFPTAFHKDVDGKITCSKSRLEIVTNSRKYSLSSGHKLSLREIDWIAAEISEWLELPVDNDWKSP